MDHKRFADTVADVQQLVHLFDPDISTSAGSAIRLLLIRPVSFIYIKLRELFSTFVTSTSLRTLSTKPATVTSVVDDIASNFFIKRRTGESAKGLLAVFLNKPGTYLPIGLSVEIDGVVFRTRLRIYISALPATVSDNVRVVTSYLYDQGIWVASVPVQAEYTGILEIPSLTPVQYSWTVSGVTDIQLLSPVTGGMDVETDQQLVERMRELVSYLVQTTLTSVQKRLEGAPTRVYSCSAQSADVASKRSMYNTAQLQLGGAIDIFIKTANQLSRAYIRSRCVKMLVDGQLQLTVPVQLTSVAGVVQVLDVRRTPQEDAALLEDNNNGHEVTDSLHYQVHFGSSDSAVPPLAARFSMLQTTWLSSPDFILNLLYIVHVAYMPDVYLVQNYIDLLENKYLGESLLIRAGLPVSVGCTLSCLSDTPITRLKKLLIATKVCGYICSLKIGVSRVNFSDVKNALLADFPAIDFRLPCVFRATIPVDGKSSYAFSTLSGILDISNKVSAQPWGARAYFFYSLVLNIEVVQI